MVWLSSKTQKIGYVRKFLWNGLLWPHFKIFYLYHFPQAIGLLWPGISSTAISELVWSTHVQFAEGSEQGAVSSKPGSFLHVVDELPSGILCRGWGPESFRTWHEDFSLKASACYSQSECPGFCDHAPCSHWPPFVLKCTKFPPYAELPNMLCLLLPMLSCFYTWLDPIHPSWA